jgi:5-methylcytosine-specific restriction protein A
LTESAPPLKFVVGETYRRRSLHELYGGQEQGGISTPKSIPWILLFTGESGREYGYQDGYREDGLFWYTGEGRRGDMKMIRGNRAINQHEKNGRALHLFQSLERGAVRYIGEGTCLGFRWETAPDLGKQPRRAIVFQLRIDGGPAGKPVASEGDSLGREVDRLWLRPLDELRRLVYEAPADSGVSAEQRVGNVYRRNAGVKAYVLRRASGVCEGCHQPAPFKMADGKPYLEPHHIRRLADGGPDHPLWVAALCPNCHRRVHHGADGTEFNEQVAQSIRAIEENFPLLF